jgi:hypothetical protein
MKQLTERQKREIAAAVAEVDPAQIAINRQMTPAQRAQKAQAMMIAEEREATALLRSQYPTLTQMQACLLHRGREYMEDLLVAMLYRIHTTGDEQTIANFDAILAIVAPRLNVSYLEAQAASYRVLNQWQQRRQQFSTMFTHPTPPEG